MSLPRIVLVLPFRSTRDPLAPFVSSSAAVHLVIAAALVVAPSFQRSRVPIADALIVDVVGGIPGPVVPPSRGTVSPAPSAPEGPRLASPPVVPDPPKKTKEVKKDPPKPRDPEPPTSAPEGRPGSGPGREPAPGPTSGTATPGPSGPGAGGITSLDALDVEFAWYRASVIAQLRSRWIRPVLEEATSVLVASVSFEVERSGVIRDARIESSSGVPAMDRSVLRAVLESSPLPPLPPTWREPTLPARFEFHWTPGDAR